MRSLKQFLFDLKSKNSKSDFTKRSKCIFFGFLKSLVPFFVCNTHDYQLNGSCFEDLNQTYIDKLFFIFNIEPLIFEKKKSKGICLSVWYENKLSIFENGNGLSTIFSIFAQHFFYI